MTKKRNNIPTDAEIERYNYLSPMLDSALEEMREFAKKKQDGIVSATKIKLINRLLKDLKEILGREASAEYLDMLDEQQLPQNSDAVLVLGQYRAALDSFRGKHFGHVYSKNQWLTRELLEEHGGA
jgi:hypothetical protein